MISNYNVVNYKRLKLEFRYPKLIGGQTIPAIRERMKKKNIKDRLMKKGNLVLYKRVRCLVKQKHGEQYNKLPYFNNV